MLKMISMELTQFFCSAPLVSWGAREDARPSRRRAAKATRASGGRLRVGRGLVGRRGVRVRVAETAVVVAVAHVVDVGPQQALVLAVVAEIIAVVHHVVVIHQQHS